MFTGTERQLLQRRRTNMRESELRDWIEELAEANGAEEREQSQRREQERQELEEMRQRRYEKLRERCDEEGVDPDLLLSLFEYEEEPIGEFEEEIEERRQTLIEQGENVDLPNETPAFLDGMAFRSDGSTAHQPFYVEIRGHEGEREYSEYHPESIDVRVMARRSGERDKKTVNWWFSVTPDRTKLWDFRITIPYRGFRLQRSATPPPYSDSFLTLKEEYRVHQYNPGPREVEERLWELHRNINVNTRFDRVLSGHYAHVLARGDPASFHVHQRFEVAAYGPARTELDFGTGTGNRLPAPYFYMS